MSTEYGTESSASKACSALLCSALLWSVAPQGMALYHIHLYRYLYLSIPMSYLSILSPSISSVQGNINPHIHIKYTRL
jgi:hypothetical protein